MRLGSKLVRIYYRGRLIKVHPRKDRGGRSTDPEDYPSELSAYTLRAPDRIKLSAASHGPAVAACAERLFDGPLPWARIRQGHRLIRLEERYSPERLDAACRRALSVDLIDVRRLDRILVEALEQETAETEPPPMPPGWFAQVRVRLRSCQRHRHSTCTRRMRMTMTTATELTPLLKRLKLGAMLNTLPERIALARREELRLRILHAGDPHRRGQPQGPQAAGAPPPASRLRSGLAVSRTSTGRHPSRSTAPRRRLLTSVPTVQRASPARQPGRRGQELHRTGSRICSRPGGTLRPLHTRR